MSLLRGRWHFPHVNITCSFQVMVVTWILSPINLVQSYLCNCAKKTWKGRTEADEGRPDAPGNSRHDPMERSWDSIIRPPTESPSPVLAYALAACTASFTHSFTVRPLAVAFSDAARVCFFSGSNFGWQVNQLCGTADEYSNVFQHKLDPVCLLFLYPSLEGVF